MSSICDYCCKKLLITNIKLLKDGRVCSWCRLMCFNQEKQERNLNAPVFKQDLCAFLSLRGALERSMTSLWAGWSCSSLFINLHFNLLCQTLTVSLLVAADRPSLRASERSHLSDHQRLQHGNKEGRHQEDHGGRSGLRSPGGQILRVHQVTWQQTW